MMICPKCGKEISDDKLLCEYCGEEVKFVPLFDAEIENQIDETINNIIKNLDAPEKNNQDKVEADENEDNDKSFDAKEKFYQGLAITALGIICSLTVIWLLIRFVIGINTSSSFSYQYEKAIECMESMEYEDAIKYLEHALKIEPEDMNARYYLGDLYIKTGQYQSGVMALEEILKIDFEDKDKAYKSLLQAILEKKDYKKLAQILEDCPYDAILAEYADYTALVPTFNYEDGVYQDKLTLEISNINSKGIIYYTLDGSKPSTNSPVYNEPIELESGQYTINAFFVNFYGCSSKDAVGSFYVSLSHPQNPEVVLDTGVYNEPMLIEVFHDKSTKIYYTLDGTAPDEHSNRYTEPFEMPFGTSNIAFVAINENGLRSDIVRRTYQLEVVASVKSDTAIELIKNHLIVKGDLEDKQGKIKGKDAYNVYFIRTIIKQDGKQYYIIDEYYNDGINPESKTNNTYAIDTKDGSAYKAVKTGESHYNLKKL